VKQKTKQYRSNNKSNKRTSAANGNHCLRVERIKEIIFQYMCAAVKRVIPLFCYDSEHCLKTKGHRCCSFITINGIRFCELIIERINIPSDMPLGIVQ